MLRTGYAWFFGTLNTIFWGSLSLVGSIVDHSGRWAHRCMVIWSRINLRLMGTRVVASGLEHIDPLAPQVLAVNHQSMADILVLAATLPVPFRFIAKRELFDIPFLGWHMRRAGFIPIERRQPRRAAKTILEASERIRSGVNALVFPEGTRSLDGELLKFHGGGFLLAIQSGVPVVPIALHGTAEINPKGRWAIRRAEARVLVLEPIETKSFESDREGLTELVRQRIAGALEAADDDSHGPVKSVVGD